MHTARGPYRRRRHTPPSAVRRYMAEHGDTEEEVRQYILRQVEDYQLLVVGNTTLGQWLGFKLGCPASAAIVAVHWAKQ